MADAAVDAAVADEAHQMHRAAVGRGSLERGPECLGVSEFALANVAVDSGDPLVDDMSRADVQVADFAVAHLSFG